MNFKQLVFGVSSFLPFVSDLFLAHPTGVGCDARYCYSVWLRHLVTAYQSGLLKSPPKTFAELGPGDSLGIGIAALLSGAENYYAFDVVEYASNSSNLLVFDELVELFRNRSPIPAEDEFPRVRPQLDDYSFPGYVLPAGLLQQTLSDERIDQLRKSLMEVNKPGSSIHYLVPWSVSSNYGLKQANMILSQAVMQYIDNLEEVYQGISEWLADDGMMSHVIDFSSHGYLDQWNGHYSYSPIAWKLLRGKRPYFINRVPCSIHLNIMQKSGFSTFHVVSELRESSVKRSRLHNEFKALSDKDICTANALVQAVKHGYCRDK